MKRILSILLSLFCAYTIQSQVVVNGNETVTSWIQDVLVGEGVSVSNVMVNGMPGNQLHIQVGGFSDANQDIGLGYGMILGTGNINMASQPNIGGGSSLPGAGDNYTFAPLEALTPFSVNDQVIIEFDFIPQGDTLTFNYVFASEEYEEYVCGTVNDVFGFFLSGTNPAGGVYVNENIALIPDPADSTLYTSTPVSINTVNPGVVGSNGQDANCSDIDPNWADYNIFYTPNVTNTYEYDGRTVILTARAIVNCGESYHITLGIGDGGDTAFDSAVFLEAGSFSAEPAGLTLQSLFPLGLVEISSTCDTAVARISRPCSADSAFYVLNYLINDSTATYGFDYQPLPTFLYMLPGQTDSLFGIITIPDGVAEDVEYICIEISESDSEFGTYTVLDTACVAIIDSYTFPVIADQEYIYCPKDSAELLLVPEFPGVGPFTYGWYLEGDLVYEDNPYLSAVPVNFLDTLIYDLIIVDFCGAMNDPQQSLVANFIPPYPSTEIIEGSTYCPGLGHELTAQNFGGTSPFTYTWTDEYGIGQPDQALITVDPQVSYPFDEDGQVLYFLSFSDNCDPTRIAHDTIAVAFPEPMSVTTNMNDFICTDQVLDLTIVSSGGYPPYIYSWTVGGGLPLVIEPFPFTGIGTAVGFIEDQIMNPEALYVLELQMDDWCSSQAGSVVATASDADTVEARSCFVPNVVSANGDEMNDSFIVYRLINTPGTMSIYNRWGNLLKQTSLPEWKPQDEPSGTYFYTVQYNNGESEKGSFTILR
jgi:gliding motility-associated-like protein